jgi:hypothetical protein
MRFCLIDATNGVPTAQGLGLSGSALADIAHACSVQLNLDYSTHWGGNFEVRAGAGAGDIQPGEIVFAILQTLPNAPGAIAYHDVNGNGVPTLFDGITLSDTLTGPGNSLSVAISHELLETAGDAGCNLWADGHDGSEYAHELCDAVESQTYGLDGIYVSNFVLPSFFVPGSAGPYDHMSYALLSGAVGPAKPLATASGGYQILRSAGAGEHQVQALTSEGAARFARRALKRARPESRQSRRGLRP